MTAGVLVLVGGLVSAFVGTGIFVLHGALARNEDENMIVREGASRPSADIKAAALEDLKRPLPPPPKATPANPASVAVKPQELPNVAPSKPVEKPQPVVAAPPPVIPVIAAKVPEGPP